MFAGSYILSKPKYYSATAPSFSVGYDVAPGGTYGTQGILYEQARAKEFFGKTFKFANAKFYDLKPTHSFIPTVSALAYKKSNPDLAEILNNRNLVSTCETPFDSYYAPVQNEKHVELTVANVAFIMNEINNPQTGNTLKIEGPGTVCNSGTFTSVNASPTTSWVSSNPTLASITATGAVATLTRNNAGNGTVTITATNPGGCSVTKTVIIGTQTTSSLTANGSACYGNLELCAVPVTGNVSHEWVARTENGDENLSESSDWCVQVPPNTLWVDLFVTNSCGASQKRHRIYYTNCYYTYSISPNPSSDFVEVTAKKDSNISPKIKQSVLDEELKNVEVKLYNKNSQLLKNGKLKDGKIKFNTNNLPNDMYYIYIVNGEKTIKENIIIAH